MAFANGGLAYLHRLLDDTIELTMEDGSPFPLEYLEEAYARSNDVVEQVAWNRGDILAVDNTTVLHGRPAFVDPDRRIYVRMCSTSRDRQLGAA